MAEWFELSENHNRRSYDFRRNKNKKFFIVIAVIVLIAFVMAKDLGGIRTTIKEKTSEISLPKKDYVIVGTGVQCLNLEGTEGYLCDMACGDLEYYKTKCENNEMVCYCIKTLTEQDNLKEECTQKLNDWLEVQEAKGDDWRLKKVEKFEIGEEKEAEEFYELWCDFCLLSMNNAHFEKPIKYPLVLMPTTRYVWDGRYGDQHATIPFICNSNGEIINSEFN